MKGIFKLVSLLLVIMLAACGSEESAKLIPATSLAAPVALTLADGAVLDTGGIGHAAPYYGDCDGDGVKELLVGEFKDGALRIYKNNGTNDKPEFQDFEFFKIGDEQAIVPPS